MTAPSSNQAFRSWMYATSFEDIPPDVRRLAVLAMYDTIGGILACSLIPTAHRMVDFVKVVGGTPDCTIIGFPQRTSVLNAALVNGTLGHGDEMDAVGVGWRGHIVATCTGAALAAGQLAGASGQEVVRAVVLGHELSYRVQRVATQVPLEPGRASGPVDAGNTLGAAAAAGIALGLPPDQMDVALSLAAYMACGITAFGRETQHMGKSFVRGGIGAKNGVAAALLAKVGYDDDAPRDIFDGPEGLFDSRLGLKEPGPEFLRGLGEDYPIRGIVFKRQSAGSPVQVPRQALLDIMTENGLTADDIGEIVLEVSSKDFDKITSVHGTTIDGKDVLALAAVYGGMGFREAHQETFYQSPQVLSMREHIKIRARPGWTREKLGWHAVVTVTHKDGRVLRKEAGYRRMTEGELDGKFIHLVSLRAGEAKAKELARVLKRLDTVRNVADVMVQLELPEARIDQI